MCRFNEIFAKLRFPQRIACHARVTHALVRCARIYADLWHLSDGSCTFNALWLKI